MEDLSPDEAKAILAASRLGVLAFAEGGQSYAVPLYFAHDGTDVYFHCHPGLKDEFLARTEEACLVVMHVESENVWESVQVFGALEKLTLSDDIRAAKNALFAVPFPPAAGSFPGGTPIRTGEAVYYLRLRPTRIAGKASTYKEPDEKHRAPSDPGQPR